MRSLENTSLSFLLFAAARMKLRVVLSSCYPVTYGIGQIWEKETLNDALELFPGPCI